MRAARQNKGRQVRLSGTITREEKEALEMLATAAGKSVSRYVGELAIALNRGAVKLQEVPP